MKFHIDFQGENKGIAERLPRKGFKYLLTNGLSFSLYFHF